MGNYEKIQKYKIIANFMRVIESITDKAHSAVLFSMEDWFRTTTEVRQGYLLSAYFFNIFLERTMREALDDHEARVSIAGLLINDMRFVDIIVLNVNEEEAEVLVDQLDTTTTRYKIGFGSDKTKVMTNNQNNVQGEMEIKSQRLETIENFKYLGSIISNEGTKPENLSRIAEKIAALSRLIS